MGVVATSFGIAAAATVALSCVTMGPRHPSSRLALMLLAFWGVANVTDAWIDPWMDAAGFYAAILVWWHTDVELPEDVEAPVAPRQTARWSLILALVFLSQQIIHFVFHDPLSVMRMGWLNALLAVALLTVCWPSADRILRHLRNHMRPDRPSRGQAVVVRSEEG